MPAVRPLFFCLDEGDAIEEELEDALWRLPYKHDPEKELFDDDEVSISTAETLPIDQEWTTGGPPCVEKEGRTAAHAIRRALAHAEVEENEEPVAAGEDGPTPSWTTTALCSATLLDEGSAMLGSATTAEEMGSASVMLGSATTVEEVGSASVVVELGSATTMAEPSVEEDPAVLQALACAVSTPSTAASEASSVDVPGFFWSVTDIDVLVAQAQSLDVSLAPSTPSSAGQATVGDAVAAPEALEEQVSVAAESQVLAVEPTSASTELSEVEQESGVGALECTPVEPAAAHDVVADDPVPVRDEGAMEPPPQTEPLFQPQLPIPPVTTLPAAVVEAPPVADTNPLRPRADTMPADLGASPEEEAEESTSLGRVAPLPQPLSPKDYFESPERPKPSAVASAMRAIRIRALTMPSSPMDDAPSPAVSSCTLPKSRCAAARVTAGSDAEVLASLRRPSGGDISPVSSSAKPRPQLGASGTSPSVAAVRNSWRARADSGPAAGETAIPMRSFALPRRTIGGSDAPEGSADAERRRPSEVASAPRRVTLPRPRAETMPTTSSKVPSPPPISRPEAPAENRGRVESETAANGGTAQQQSKASSSSDTAQQPSNSSARPSLRRRSETTPASLELAACEGLIPQARKSPTSSEVGDGPRTKRSPTWSESSKTSAAQSTPTPTAAGTAKTFRRNTVANVAAQSVEDGQGLVKRTTSRGSVSSEGGFNIPRAPASSSSLVAEPTLRPVGAGSGGIEEMRDLLDDSDGHVRWAFLKFFLGTGAFRRQKLLTLHINGAGCPAVMRGRVNQYHQWVLNAVCGSEELGAGGPKSALSLSVHSKAEVTTETLLDRVMPFLVKDDLGNGNAQFIKEDYVKQVREASKAAEAQLERGSQVPGHRSSLFKDGRHALQAVSDFWGAWNWVLLSPDPATLPLLAGGDGGWFEMQERLQEHPSEVVAAAFRMSFGEGRLRRTKHVLIFVVGEKVGPVARGKLPMLRPKIEKALADYMLFSCVIEVAKSDDLSLDAVIDRVRRAAHIDDEVLDGDGKRRRLLTAQSYRESLLREKKVEPEVKSTKREYSERPVKEVIQMLHTDPTLNWGLFALEDIPTAQRGHRPAS